MSNRRMDAIYFGVLLSVFAVAFFVANRPMEEEATLEIPDFSLPRLSFEIPVDFPYTPVEFESRVAPTLDLSHGMESALDEVRWALLKSSALHEVEVREEWVAALE